MNVCGVKNRLCYPEFKKLINDFDIICLSETKLSDIDIIDADNFMFKYKNRKKFNNRSGGIALGYKMFLNEHIKVFETDCPFVLWFSVDKKLLKTSQNVIFGIIYVPPEGSKYGNDDAFSEIELEFQKFNRFSNFVCLLGDMNARTGNLLDFVEQENPEDFFTQNIVDINSFSDIDILEGLGIPKMRNSMDETVNRYGRKLIDLCKNNNLFIFNGRVGNDVRGNPTSKNLSVIDYIISTASVLQLVNDFEIFDFSKLFSDIHSPLSLKLISSEKPQNVGIVGTAKIKKWKPEKRTDFEKNLNSQKIQNLQSNLSNVDINNITDEEVNSYIQETVSILLTSAEKTFGKTAGRKGAKGNFTEQPNKLWFNENCKKARKDFRKAKRMYNKYGSNIFNTRLKISELNYKKTMDESIFKFNREMRDKMRKLKSQNPKEFWKLFRNDRRENTHISLDVFFEFFKDLNKNKFDEQNNYDIPNDVNGEHSEVLNGIITKEEISKAIRAAKNNKASGDDKVINEYIAASFSSMGEIYVTLFNLVFDSGIVPEEWLKGIIIPIYKNKGGKLEPKNYRPVTLLSCLGKIFTSVLNSRLNKFIEENSILNENQAGFRSGYSTNDHIFSLYALFELLTMKKKKLHCAFIDFEKAFDFVHRNSLFFKLFVNSIGGKFLRIIQNMYNEIKSCIRYNNESTEFFKCEIGVRQGENLSPILFSLYLNDLQSYLEEQNMVGLESISNDVENELMVYIKILLFLYADDTILLSESSKDLQNMLDNFAEYCEHWKLKINTDKTKILIFSKGRISKNEKYFLNGKEIEVVKSYKYLGVFFARSGCFLTTRNYLKNQATKAMYSLLQKCRKHNMSIECQLDMFDKAILPILLYGSEIWGFEKFDILERVHLKFCKIILNLKQTTPASIVYGELGRYPISVSIKLRMVKFWCRLVNGDDNKISSILYKLLFINFNNYGFESRWLTFIKTIFDDCGLTNVWSSQNYFSPEWIEKSVESRLLDQFKQEWSSEIFSSSKTLCYRIFKTDFCFEKYLSILPPHLMFYLCKFRCSCHRLPIESGRWNNTPRNDRLCTLCDLQEIGDEYHYIFKCKQFMVERKNLLPDYCQKYDNILKLNTLFNSTNVNVLENLAKFIICIFKKVVPPG